MSNLNIISASKLKLPLVVTSILISHLIEFITFNNQYLTILSICRLDIVYNISYNNESTITSKLSMTYDLSVQSNGLGHYSKFYKLIPKAADHENCFGKLNRRGKQKYEKKFI